MNLALIKEKVFYTKEKHRFYLGLLSLLLALTSHEQVKNKQNNFRNDISELTGNENEREENLSSYKHHAFLHLLVFTLF